MTTTYGPRGTRGRPADGMPSRSSTGAAAMLREVTQQLDEMERAQQQLRGEVERLAAALQQPVVAGTSRPGRSGRGPEARRLRQAQLRRQRRLLIGGAAVLLLLLLWLVVGGDDAPTSPHAGHDMSTHAAASSAKAPGSTVPVELGEFFLTPKYGSVKAGSISFELRNSGDAEHEFMIADVDDLAAEDVASMTSDEVHAKVVAAKHGLAAGSSDVLVADLEPGTYLLFCNLAGHFAQGQSTTLTVV